MEKVRIQDDLYQYVNGEWLKKAVIPSDKPTIGGFANLAKEVEEKMINDLNRMNESKDYPDEYLKNACLLFAQGKNTSRRNKAGITPCLSALEKIDNLKNIKEMNKVLSLMIKEGAPLPFEISVDADMKNSANHCLMLQGPSTILPDTTYYAEAMKPQRDMILGFWKNMAKGLLSNTSLSEEKQSEYIENALKFDAILATLVKSMEEWSDYVNVYNPFASKRVLSLLKPLDAKKAFTDLFGFVPEEIIVADPRFLKGFKTLFNEENFKLYKSWAYIRVLVSAAPYLSETLRNIGTSYQRALTGVAKMTNATKHSYQTASYFFSEPMGLYYGRKYFGEEAKKDIVEMVYEIIETYKKRVRANNFLADSTKEKAILKLSTMKVKMGYPDACDPFYGCLVVNKRASYYENVCSLNKLKRADNFAKLTKPVDRGEWAMPGHMVNACYNPFANDITFPAAILQPPFYSIHQTRSENLGGIGAVIGHEISHAFDNNGAKFDEKGNLADWWTKEDFKQFNKKTKAMIKEFEGIELPWGKVNSKLIVSENIADNGGMAVSLQIMGTMEDANYEEYFKNWAKVWCMKGKEGYLKLLLSVDVHAPTVLRANMQPRNFKEWYETFNVTSKDKMYIAPNKRVIIW